MRILVASPHCRPDWINQLGVESQGGQTVVMNKLYTVMAAQSPEIHVDIFTRLQEDDPFAKDVIKTLGNDRVRLIRLSCGPTDRYIPKEKLYGKYIDEFVQNILNFVQKESIKYDLLHGHYADGWETVRKISRKLSIPYVLTTHSLGRSKKQDCLQRKEDNEKALDKKYNFSIRINSEEKSLEKCTKLCPLSSFEKLFILKHYKALKNRSNDVYPIANGLDLKDFPEKISLEMKQEIRNKIKLPSSKFTILIPSRVDARKGQLNAVIALNKIPATIRQNIKLVMLCWPDELTDYAKIVQRKIKADNLEDYIIKLPAIPHNQMYKYLHTADTILLPSQEYFSIVMLEGMYSQTPVIASKFSGASDAIENNKSGILIDHNNTNEIALAIQHCLDLRKSQLAEIGTQAKKIVLQKYTWTKISKAWLKIYNSTIKQ